MKKIKVVAISRAYLEKFLLKLPLLKINPDILSFSSLLFSLVFLLSPSLTYQIVVLGIVLIFDLLDGLTAKKFNYRQNEREKEYGWLIDTIVDRLSEVIILTRISPELFALVVINSILNIYSYKTKRHIILPLRQILLIYLIFQL